MHDLESYRADPKKYHEEAAICDAGAFQKIAKSRRSIRRFTSEPIPPEVTRACIDLALEAPNSSNLQSWEFHWIRTPALKEELAHACLDQAAARTAAELIVCVARRGTWRRNAPMIAAQLEREGLPTATTLAYYRRLVYILYTVGLGSFLAPLKWLVLTIVGIFRPMPRGPLTKSDLRVWTVKSCALACENLMLAYRAHGYDTCPMEGYDDRRVRRLIKLPRDAEIVMVIGAGRRSKGGVYGPKLRLDASLFVFEH